MHVGPPGCIACGSGDTWVLPLADNPPKWTTLATTGTKPNAVSEYSAIYDPVRDRMVVFGGSNGTTNPSYTNAVSVLTFSPTPTWSTLSPTGTPPIARGGQTAIYDPTGDRMIIFGGHYPMGFLNDVILNEAWSLSLSGTPAWTFLTPTDSVPPARFGHTSVVDPIAQRMIIHGGSVNDTWAMSLTAGNVATWTQLPSVPPGRNNHFACWDTVGERMMIYGGTGACGVRTDLWALEPSPGPVWSLIGPYIDPPPPFSQHAMVVDSSRSRAYALLGFACSEPSDETWTRSLLSDSGWVEVAGATRPAARSAHVGVSDPEGDRALIFGGNAFGTVFNDTWEFDYGSQTWSQLMTVSQPSERSYAFGAFDRMRRRLIIYGGGNEGQSYPYYRDDTWAFDAVSGTWSQLAAGSLGGRAWMTGIYDPLRDRMVAFGGSDTLGSYNDVHVLDLGPGGMWAPLATQGSPPPSSGEARSIYDPAGDRMLVVAPLGGTVMGVWALSLGATPTWAQLLPPPLDPHPPGRYPITRSAELIPDFPRGRLVMFGGPYSETWALNLNDTYPLAVEPLPAIAGLNRVTPNPSRGPIHLAFTLSGGAPARLEVIDLQGRRVIGREVGGLGPGAHTLRLDEARHLAPGLYFVRLIEGRRMFSTKAAIVK
jgi:hypothetical protein